MIPRLNRLFHSTPFRYLFGLAAIVGAFALRVWLAPLTGSGAPSLLFFAATVVTALLVGVGPGILAMLLCVPLATYTFAMRAGSSLLQASFQALLFAVDGFAVIYVTSLVNRRREALRSTNRQLQDAYEDIRRSEARTRDLLELAPDAFFLADLEGFLTAVNRAAANLLGYTPEELLGKSITDIITEEDVPRLWRTRNQLQQGGSHTAEWTHRHKDGTLIPVEVSSRILEDGRWQAFARDIRERKRIEDEREQLLAGEQLARTQVMAANEKLRESEERFRLTIDEAPIGMALVALDGRFVRVNRALCAIVGYQPAELAERTFQSITHPDDLDRDLALAGQLGRGEIPHYQRETRYLRKDGSTVDILLTASVPRSGDGAALYYIVQIEDITERKRAQDALRRSEAQFRGLIEHMPDGVFAYHGGRISYANDAFARSLGYERADALVGRPVGSILHPDDRSVVAKRIRTLRDTGQPVPPRELRMLGRDGSVRFVETVGLHAQFEGWPSIVVTVRDLTQRRQAEEALRLSEQEQLLLSEAGATLAASLDYEQTLATVARLAVRDFADWCIVDIVDEDARFWRRKVVSADPAGAALCARLEQITIDRDRPHLVQEVARTLRPLLIAEVTPRRIESFAQSPEHLEALHALGARSLMALPLVTHGQVVGALVFISSTASRRYGQHDLRMAQALAERAAVAIENARLYRSAMQAIRVRDQVLGVVAHDLRNPLGTILLQASALRRQVSQGRLVSRSSSEIILRSATRMSRMIEDLLDVARMDAGQLRINRTSLSASRLAVEAMDSQKTRASSSSLELRLDLEHDLPEVFGDHDRLLQVFENLVGNAMKFTPAGGRITVGATAGEGDVVFRVADTGSGISPESQPHVFDRFWQASRSGSGGAGLGLAISKGIVEAHGGRMWVESSPGQGSTFFFSIPRRALAHDERIDLMH